MVFSYETMVCSYEIMVFDISGKHSSLVTIIIITTKVEGQNAGTPFLLIIPEGARARGRTRTKVRVRARTICSCSSALRCRTLSWSWSWP